MRRHSRQLKDWRSKFEDEWSDDQHNNMSDAALRTKKTSHKYLVVYFRLSTYAPMHIRITTKRIRARKRYFLFLVQINWYRVQSEFPLSSGSATRSCHVTHGSFCRRSDHNWNQRGMHNPTHIKSSFDNFTTHTIACMQCAVCSVLWWLRTYVTACVRRSFYKFALSWVY